jgi:hypothetical protein
MALTEDTMGDGLRRAAGLSGVAALLVAGLVGVLAFARPDSALPPAAPADSARQVPAVYLGLSGNLRAIELVADRPAPSPLAALVPALARPVPGVLPTGLEAPDGEPIRLFSLLPFSAKPGGSWHGYRVGFWPGERSGRSRARYPLPDGFIEVTAADADLPLSTHFRVRDFLTHDQPETWPKLLVIRLPLLDKLELIRDALSSLGRAPALRVMSGFRTPQYNAQGVGPLGGRARDSRHMYGDAADIYVDADGDGQMDDLDGDGRVTVNDARWLAALAGRVEAAYPGVTGGIGVYRATSAHGPFVHVDVRGTPARW